MKAPKSAVLGLVAGAMMAVVACGSKPPPAAPVEPAPSAAASAEPPLTPNPPTVQELPPDAPTGDSTEDGSLHPEELSPGVRLGMSRAAYEGRPAPSTTEGGAAIRDVHVEYANGRLSYFRFSAGKAGCAALKARFLAKYGKPTKNGPESFFDARGATIFVNDKVGGSCSVGIQKH